MKSIFLLALPGRCLLIIVAGNGGKRHLARELPMEIIATF